MSHAHSAFRKDNDEATPWVIKWIVENAPDTSELSSRIHLLCAVHGLAEQKELSWEIEALPDVDWLEKSYQQFPAFSVGPFFVHGSHHQGNVPGDLLGLQIDAATAFGSGEHPTTRGCILAMAALNHQGVCPWNVLDMGTGSGILAIAAWKIWKTHVLAVDNDAEAVRMTCLHRKLNEVPAHDTGLICKQGDGFSAPIVHKKKPFDLVIANILAGPLIEMAHDLRQVVDENGYIVLSGILNEQADSVLSVYEAEGLKLITHNKIEEWSTLVLHNSG